MSLRSILASEGLIVTAGLSDKAQLAVMKKYNHPSLKSTRTFLSAVSTVYHEFEVTNPVEFKEEIEDNQGQATMPLEFYRELVAAVKLDEKSYWDKKKLAGLHKKQGPDSKKKWDLYVASESGREIIWERAVLPKQALLRMRKADEVVSGVYSLPDVSPESRIILEGLLPYYPGASMILKDPKTGETWDFTGEDATEPEWTLRGSDDFDF